MTIFKDARNQKGIKQIQAARDLNLPRETLNRIEHGVRTPALKQLVRLRHYYGLTDKMIGDYLDSLAQ